MLFARVVGTAVCTLKVRDIEGVKLLIVQPLNKKLEPAGSLQVAADVVYAGPGDLCVLTRSREAALAMRDETFVPVDLAIIGIVDEYTLSETGDVTLKRGKTRYT